MSDFFIPLLIIFILLLSVVKRLNAYESFTLGAKESVPLIISLLPNIAAMFIAIELLDASGVDDFLVKICAPFFNLFGMPPEIAKLVILRPFSGSGSLAMLEEIYFTYGADSYIARCASIILGSTETVFYVAAVYFSATKIKRPGCCIPIALGCSFVGCVVACALCRIM